MNIVWILLDHLIYRHHDHDDSPYPPLPALKRLRSEGVFFENALSVCPLCTPARASMLTGTYPHRHGLVQNTGSGFGPDELTATEAVFSAPLREAGFRCGYFGKWHCGRERIAADFGFEGFSAPDYGNPYGLPQYREYLEAHRLPEPVVDLEWHFSPANRPGKTPLIPGLRGPRPHMAAGVLTSPAATHETSFVMSSACDWIAERADAGERFCVRVDPWGPHHPYFVPSEFAGMIDPASIPEYPNFSHDLADRPQHHRNFLESVRRDVPFGPWTEWQWLVARAYEHVAFVDSAIGRLLDHLDRLGIAAETTVILTADHGDALGSHGGVIDKDSMMVEETMRIPLVVRAPGLFPEGVVSPALVTNMDIVPTLYDIAEMGTAPASDGESLLLPATRPDEFREQILCEHHGHQIDCYQRYLRRGEFVYVANLTDQDELYRVGTDPYQMQNLIHEESCADVAAELRRRLRGEMEAHGDVSSDRARRMIQRLAG